MYLSDAPFYWSSEYYDHGAYGYGFGFGESAGILIDDTKGLLMLVRSDKLEPSIISEAAISAETISETLKNSEYRLSWKFESIKEIDRFFLDQTLNGKPKSNGLLSENTDSKLFGLGFYLGGKIISKCGGRWQVDTDNNRDLAVILPDGSKIWPIQKVVKRLQNGEDDSLWFYSQTIVGLKCTN